MVYTRALFSTFFFVPILSRTALERYLHHDPSKVDNVLLSWLMAISFAMRNPQFKIVPIVFDGYYQIVDTLPRVVPTATILKAKSNMSQCGIIFDSESIDFMTVHAFVNTLNEYLNYMPREQEDALELSVSKIFNIVANPRLILPARFDALIEYRWGDYDTQFVASLFDRLTLLTVGSTNRPFNVFLDTKILPNGDNVFVVYTRALFSTFFRSDTLSDCSRKMFAS